MSIFKDGGHRTIFATMPCMYDKHILLLSLSRLKRYSKTVYISKDYSPQEEKQQKTCLKKVKNRRTFSKKKLEIQESDSIWK